jgi:hypothetical protein
MSVQTLEARPELLAQPQLDGARPSPTLPTDEFSAIVERNFPEDTSPTATNEPYKPQFNGELGIGWFDDACRRVGIETKSRLDGWGTRIMAIGGLSVLATAAVVATQAGRSYAYYRHGADTSMLPDVPATNPVTELVSSSNELRGPMLTAASTHDDTIRIGGLVIDLPGDIDATRKADGHNEVFGGSDTATKWSKEYLAVAAHDAGLTDSETRNLLAHKDSVSDVRQAFYNDNPSVKDHPNRWLIGGTAYEVDDTQSAARNEVEQFIDNGRHYTTTSNGSETGTNYSDNEKSVKYGGVWVDPDDYDDTTRDAEPWKTSKDCVWNWAKQDLAYEGHQQGMSNSEIRALVNDETEIRRVMNSYINNDPSIENAHRHWLYAGETYDTSAARETAGNRVEAYIERHDITTGSGDTGSNGSGDSERLTSYGGVRIDLNDYIDNTPTADLYDRGEDSLRQWAQSDLAYYAHIEGATDEQIRSLVNDEVAVQQVMSEYVEQNPTIDKDPNHALHSGETYYANDARNAAREIAHNRLYPNDPIDLNPDIGQAAEDVKNEAEEAARDTRDWFDRNIIDVSGFSAWWDRYIDAPYDRGVAAIGNFLRETWLLLTVGALAAAGIYAARKAADGDPEGLARRTRTTTHTDTDWRDRLPERFRRQDTATTTTTTTEAVDPPDMHNPTGPRPPVTV